MVIIDELSAHDENISSDKEKVSKLIRSLSKSFEPIAMVSTSTNMNFGEVTATVQVEIERRKSPLTDKETPISDEPPPTARFGDYRDRGRWGRFNTNRGRGRGAGIGRGNENLFTALRVRYCCGKSGHFIQFCRNQIFDESQNCLRSTFNGQRRKETKTVDTFQVHTVQSQSIKTSSIIAFWIIKMSKPLQLLALPEAQTKSFVWSENKMFTVRTTLTILVLISSQRPDWQI